MWSKVVKVSAQVGLLTLDAAVHPAQHFLQRAVFELAEQQLFTSGLMAQPLSETTAAKTGFVLEEEKENSLCVLAGKYLMELFSPWQIQMSIFLSQMVSIIGRQTFCLKKVNQLSPHFHIHVSRIPLWFRLALSSLDSTAKLYHTAQNNILKKVHITMTWFHL